MPVTETINGKEITLEDKERIQCEVWVRVIGYYRPVEAFNIGKRREHVERRLFTESKAMAALNDNAGMRGAAN